MAQKTTYTCDRCSKEVMRHELSLIVLNITARHRQYAEYCSEISSGEWCKECIAASGLVAPEPKWREENQAEAPPEPTLEELIKRFIRKELDARAED